MSCDQIPCYSPVTPRKIPVLSRNREFTSNVLICHEMKSLRQPKRGQFQWDFEKFPVRFPAIHLRPENPKFGGVDDAEIVGDRIAEDGPVLRHPLAQEMQDGVAEVVVGRVAPVVGDVLVHQPP